MIRVQNLNITHNLTLILTPNPNPKPNPNPNLVFQAGIETPDLVEALLLGVVHGRAQHLHVIYSN